MTKKHEATVEIKKATARSEQRKQCQTWPKSTYLLIFVTKNLSFYWSKGKIDTKDLGFNRSSE